MHKLTAYQLGNADTTRIDLANGKKLLFDYAHVRNMTDAKDKRADLPVELRKDLKAANRTHFDVVAFTHLDRDHICDSTTFFFLEHDKKYQSADRIKITEMWVPAAVIVEDNCSDEAKIIQAEARYRLKQGSGIRVFSGPKTLAKWLTDNKINDAAHQKLVTDAGTVVPGFSLATDNVEFFVHSPHATRVADGTLHERNSDALTLQATFQEKNAATGVFKKTRVHFFADIDYCVIKDIVNITEYHANNKKGSAHLERLWWDVMHLPHHSSYKSLAEEKGKDVTTADPDVKRLYETYGQEKCIMISPSDLIPTEDTTQPPHRQAAAYYKSVKSKKNGEYLVTMEQPTKEAPKPLVIKIDHLGATLEKADVSGASAILSRPTPRAGSSR